jgi:hypothetical protein
LNAWAQRLQGHPMGQIFVPTSPSSKLFTRIRFVRLSNACTKISDTPCYCNYFSHLSPSLSPCFEKFSWWKICIVGEFHRCVAKFVLFCECVFSRPFICFVFVQEKSGPKLKTHMFTVLICLSCKHVTAPTRLYEKIKHPRDSVPGTLEVLKKPSKCPRLLVGLRSQQAWQVPRVNPGAKLGWLSCTSGYIASSRRKECLGAYLVFVASSHLPAGSLPWQRTKENAVNLECLFQPRSCTGECEIFVL